MKAHKLAKLLLTLPDKEVYVYDQETTELFKIILVDDDISDRIDINIDTTTG